MLDILRLQGRLGLRCRHHHRPGILTVPFARMGAQKPIAEELGLAANVHLRSAISPQKSSRALKRAFTPAGAGALGAFSSR